MTYKIEVVWNRAFDWSHCSSYNNFEHAIKIATSYLDMMDLNRVKKIRIIDDNGNIVYYNGKILNNA